MTIICKPSKVIPVTMCGASKNSHHNEVAFSVDEVVCQSGEYLKIIKPATEKIEEVA